MRGGLCGWQVHSVRRKSCDADSSEEPSAGGWERGNPVRGCGDFGACSDGGASSEGAELGLSAIGGRVRRGGVLGEVAELGLSAPRGLWGEGLVGALRARGEL